MTCPWCLCDALFPDSQNVEFICNVLVVADQLLISRLKEICEVAIAEKREFCDFYCSVLDIKIYFFLDVNVIAFSSISLHTMNCSFLCAGYLLLLTAQLFAIIFFSQGEVLD